MKFLYSQSFLNHVLHLMSQRELRPLLEATLQAIYDELQVSQASVILVSAQQVLETAGSHFSDTEYDTLKEGIEGWVLREKQPTLTQDLVNDVRTSGKAMAALARYPKPATIALAPCGDFGVVTAVGDALSPVNLHLLAGLGQTLAAALKNLGWQTSQLAKAHKNILAEAVLPANTADLQALALRAFQQIEQNNLPMSIAVSALAGMGKSAFATWLATQAKRHNFIPTTTSATTYDSPYAIWRHLIVALYPVLEKMPLEEEAFRRFLSEKKVSWERRSGLLMELLYPGQAQNNQLDSYSIEQKQAALTALVIDLLVEFPSPLLVIIENAQHMEEASRFVLTQLVQHLAYQNTKLFLCILTQERDTLPDVLTAHSLNPLSLEGVAALRQQLIGEATPEVDAFLLEKSQGVPQHVQFLLAALVEKNMDIAAIEKTDMSSLVPLLLQTLNESQKLAALSDAESDIPALQSPWVCGLVAEHFSLQERQRLHGQIAHELEQTQPSESAKIAYHYQHSAKPQYARSYLIQAAHIAHASGAHRDALRYITDALELPGELNSMDQFVLLTEQADLFASLNDYEKQAVALQKLSEIAREMNDAWLYADSGWRWLNYYRHTHQTTEGIATWKIFYEQAEKAYHTVAKAEISIATALLYQQTGDYESSQQHLDQAAQVATQTRKMGLGARILFTLGTVFETAASYDMAQACLEQAYEIYQQENNQVGSATCLMQLGKMYHSIGYFRSAPDLLTKAQQFWLLMGNYTEAVETGLTLAELLISINRPVAALENIMQLQPIVTRLAHQGIQGRWWFVYGLACSAIHSYEQAIGCYTQTLSAYPENAEQAHIETYIQLMYAHMKNNQPAEGQQWVEKIQTLDPTLQKYEYSPLSYLHYALVRMDPAIAATGQQVVQRQAERIADEKVKRAYLARPDRQQLLALTAEKLV